MSKESAVAQINEMDRATVLAHLNSKELKAVLVREAEDDVTLVEIYLFGRLRFAT